MADRSSHNSSDASNVEVIEPFGVDDTFVTGMTEIEDMGSHVRMSFYVERRAIWPAKGVERYLMARIVMPADAFEEVRKKIVAGTRLMLADLAAGRRVN